MIYLGNKLTALKSYSEEAVCWLGVKIKGRKTRTNPNGYSCNNTSCTICSGTGNKRRGLDPIFITLFSNNIIRDIIISKPDKLISIFNNLLNSYIAYGKTVEDFKEQCSALFVNSGYTGWFLEEKKNYHLADLLDQHTCTYCNREYIFTFKNKNGGKGMIPQFDHWFPKTNYPLLALSFYNLIPSCATCNTIKSTTTLNLNDHLHPYIDSNISNQYKFNYLPINLTSNELIIQNNSILNTKGIDTVNALNLALIYKGHSNKELQDLIDLRYKYSNNYLNILFDKTFNNLNISKQEKVRLIFGIELNEDDFSKRPLSKFKKDILTELGII